MNKPDIPSKTSKKQNRNDVVITPPKKNVIGFMLVLIN